MRIKINAQSQGATKAREATGLRLSTPSTAGLCLPGLQMTRVQFGQRSIKGRCTLSGCLPYLPY